LETRTERGFPHFPSNGGYCSLAHLKRQTRQNRGVRQILAQNQKFRGYGPYGYDVKKLIAREQAVRARQRRIRA